VVAEPGRATGGSLGRDLIGFIGSAAVLGFDPARMLRAEPAELEVLVLAARAAAEFQAQRDTALARTVVSELAAALKRGR
jgi:uncharacterized protein YigA (DUF484 family)